MRVPILTSRLSTLEPAPSEAEGWDFTPLESSDFPEGTRRPHRQENDVCKNYRVINTRLCPINHPPSIINGLQPLPAPPRGVKFLHDPQSYTYVCTDKYKAFHVEHCVHTIGIILVRQG